MQVPFQQAGAGAASGEPLVSLPTDSSPAPRPMIELNPIRQRIADLQDRLASLRGYL